jgi:hypothetical protein
MMGKTVSEILFAAADLIEPEGAWTTGSFRGTGPCFCILGALAQVGVGDAFRGNFIEGPLAEAHDLLASVIGEPFVDHWNDREGRTQAEVVAKLREAAEKAREQGL